MRHPRQEGHHHAQGHPARQEDPWRESLNVSLGFILTQSAFLKATNLVKERFIRFYNNNTKFISSMERKSGVLRRTDKISGY